MTKTNKRYLCFFLGLSIIGLTGWLYLQKALQAHRHIHSDPTKPNAFATQVTLTRFNPKGTVASRLTVNDITYFRDQARSHFTHPHITLYRGTQPPWTITAHYGRSEQQFDQITFWDHVELQQTAGTHNARTFITTQALTYRPKQHDVHTADHITLKQPKTIITATGLHADLNNSHITLLSHAKGRYQS